MLESDVRKEVREYLEKSGWFVFHIHQQGFRAYKGISDYIAIKNGTVIFVEVKKPGGKQNAGQIEFEANIKQKKGHYFCVDNLVSLIRYLGEIK